MESAKTRTAPETQNDEPQDGDGETVTPEAARIYKSCVGKARYISHHRPNIQHSVNTLSRSMKNPTMIAMRKARDAYSLVTWFM